MIITKIIDYCIYLVKNYLYFCSKTTKTHKIFRYDTGFLGKELSLHS